MSTLMFDNSNMVDREIAIANLPHTERFCPFCMDADKMTYDCHTGEYFCLDCEYVVSATKPVNRRVDNGSSVCYTGRRPRLALVTRSRVSRF